MTKFVIAKKTEFESWLIRLVSVQSFSLTDEQIKWSVLGMTLKQRICCFI